MLHARGAYQSNGGHRRLQVTTNQNCLHISNVLISSKNITNSLITTSSTFQTIGGRPDGPAN